MKRSQIKRKPPSEKGKAVFRKQRLESISHFKKLAWTEFSKYIRARDKYTCYTCLKDYSGNITRSLHAGHFISRRMNSTLFDEMNVHAQCMFCNMYNYGSTGAYAERLIKDYGMEEFQKLLKRGRESKQFTREELKEIANTYKQKLLEL